MVSLNSMRFSLLLGLMVATTIRSESSKDETLTAEKRPGGRSFGRWDLEKRGGGRLFHPIGAEEPLASEYSDDDNFGDELEPFEPYAKRPGGRPFNSRVDSDWSLEGGRMKRPGGRAFFGPQNDWGQYRNYRRRMWKRPGGRVFSGYTGESRDKRPGGRFFGGGSGFKRYQMPQQRYQWW